MITFRLVVFLSIREGGLSSCLFVLMLDVPVNNFSVILGCFPILNHEWIFPSLSFG